MKTRILTKFHCYLTSFSKVTVHFISQLFLWSQYTIPLQTLELYRLSWLKQFSKAYFKIYYIPKFNCQILGPSKVTGCSIFNYFLQVLIATSFEPQVILTIFQRFFEDTKITTRFWKRNICNDNEINTSFAIFNNKGLKNLKVSLNTMKLLTQNYQKKWRFYRDICP